MSAADANTGSSATRPAPRRSLARRLRWPLLIGAPVVAIVAGLYLYLSGGRYVSTDDAYLQAARVYVSSNISGRVVEVDVHENQRVRAGDVLFRLDTRDLDTAVQQAEAQLASARQSVTGTQATYEQRNAEVSAALQTLAFQERELARERALNAAGVASQAQVDAQAHAVDVARAQVAVSQQGEATVLASLGGRPQAPASSNPGVQEAEANLARARLARSYAVIHAPQAGEVTKVDQLQVGTYVNASAPLFSLVADRVWVDANFKEDQLTYMRPGQSAEMHIDAYPGTTFRGRVESLSPGTGSSFSVLPAENATGNWVKVVQRLPVRLSIDDSRQDLPLHAGLSVKVTVDVQHHRSLFGAKRPPASPHAARTP